MDDFAGFDAYPVVGTNDLRDYGEERFQSVGLIDGKPHSIAFTARDAADQLSAPKARGRGAGTSAARY